MAKPFTDKKVRDPDALRIVASNRKAFHELAIDDKLEAGLVLTGSEVKMLRAGKCVIQGAHIRVVAGEALLMGASIPEYPWAARWGHEPDRPRKLLLHRREIDKLEVQLRQKGATCVATRIYFKGARVKIELGIGTGKKEHDKRETLKSRDATREMQRALR